MKIFMIIFMISISLYAQEKQDTVRLRLYQIQDPQSINYENFSPDISHLRSNDAFIDSTNIRLFSSFILSSMNKYNSWSVNPEEHMLSNYLNFYIESTRFNPLYLVLGLAEAGAAGYLAYKHFEKYGWK